MDRAKLPCKLTSEVTRFLNQTSSFSTQSTQSTIFLAEPRHQSVPAKFHLVRLMLQSQPEPLHETYMELNKTLPTLAVETELPF